MAKASETRTNGSTHGGNENKYKFFKLTGEEDQLRFMPPHNEDLAGCANISSLWAAGKISKRDAAGNIIPDAFDIKNIRIFNSVYHGGLSKDLLEQYVIFAVNKFKEAGFEKESLGMALKPINGLYNKDTKKWVYQPLRYAESKAFWVFHKENNSLEILEMSNKEFTDYYIKMNEELTTRETPLGIDVISDVELGRFIRVYKNKENKTAYSILQCPERSASKIEEWFKEQILSEEVVEDFKKLPTIESIYEKKFSRFQYMQQLNLLNDLEKNLKGYTITVNGEQKKVNYNFLSDPEFMAIAEEIAAEVEKMYPQNYHNSGNAHDDNADHSNDQKVESKPEVKAEKVEQKENPAINASFEEERSADSNDIGDDLPF